MEDHRQEDNLLQKLQYLDFSLSCWNWKTSIPYKCLLKVITIESQLLRLK